MSARTKPLKVAEPVAVDQLTSFTEFGLPPAKAGVKLVSADNVDELVSLLREDARAI
jgi:electron transfer flavoprotein beta subunit